MTSSSEGIGWKTLQQSDATYLQVQVTATFANLRSTKKIIAEPGGELFHGHSILV